MANSWTSAEENAFAYLLSELGDTEDVTGFIGEFPAGFADVALDYIWYFAITGGNGEPDDVGAGVSYCGMNADAIFEGVFETREKAQEYGIAVKNLLPVANGTIANILDLRLTREPSIERAVVKRDPDQTEGGELRVWRLTIPLSCVVVAAGD